MPADASCRLPSSPPTIWDGHRIDGGLLVPRVSLGADVGFDALQRSADPDPVLLNIMCVRRSLVEIICSNERVPCFKAKMQAMAAEAVIARN